MADWIQLWAGGIGAVVVLVFMAEGFFSLTGRRT